MDNPYDILLRISRVFEQLPADYVVVGSFASSLRGMVRATNDVDMVVDLKVDQIFPLVNQVAHDFYVSELSVRRAISLGRSFNLIHFDSAFKVDVFIPPPGGFGWQQLARRCPEQLSPDRPDRIYVATAEDIVLAKLDWYRRGGQVSTQQWADILGVMRISGPLDADYLHEQAAQLGLAPLLERVLIEADKP
ncbi:MAG: hypothetical protein WKF30_14600 [Pyrinomonadaceae bacterium]